MSEKLRHEIPHLHVRPPRRIVGVGGEGDRPDASIVGNRAGLLMLREQIDRALDLEDGIASAFYGHREVDGRRFDLTVHRATRPEQMGEAREPAPPDYSMFA